MSEFFVGQRVVCVDDENHPERRNPMYSYTGSLQGLKKGAVYTIREIHTRIETGSVAAKLCEIVRPINDAGYWIGRFRPLESKAIQIFRDIAANPGKPIPDNAPDEIEQREIAAVWDAGGRVIW